jgi:transcriptional regulator with XRE-family HTH domain
MEKDKSNAAATDDSAPDFDEFLDDVLLDHDQNQKGSRFTPTTGTYMYDKCLIMGYNLRNQRKKLGFTVNDLARFLDISAAYVGLIERGARCPSLEIFLRSCDFLSTTPQEMLKPPESFGKTKRRVSLSDRRYVEDSDISVEDQTRITIGKMVETFDSQELEHIVIYLKSFKRYSFTARGKKRRGKDIDPDLDIPLEGLDD